MYIGMLHSTVPYIFAYFILQISALGSLGPGIWSLKSISRCSAELDEEVATVDINKHKLNRTHDAFSTNVKSLDDIGDNYGGLLETCMYVDGGCKPHFSVAGDSVAKMFKEYGKEESIVSWFKSANIDPPDFPIPKGEYQVDDFVMNFCDLPRNYFYGKFESTGYIMRESKKVACLKGITEFNKFDDDTFCDE